MALFQNQAKNDHVASLEAMDDRELFRRWLSVGVQLFDDCRQEFDRAFAACLRGFEFEGDPLPAPCLDNWEVIGSKFIMAGGERRKAACVAIVEALDALRESSQTSTAEQSGITFIRMCRLVERIIDDAADYIRTDPEVDKFFIELEDDEASELQRLHQLHPELVIAGLAMSLNEWALSYPTVELIQVVFGERSMDIRVQRPSN